MGRASAVAPVAAAPTHAEKSGKDKTAGDKRKVVRRDLEKRRQQNLHAQKRYRDRLRKRLDDLEVLAASVAKQRETAAALPATPLSNESSPPDVRLEDEWTSLGLADGHEGHGCQTQTTPSDAFFLPSMTGDDALGLSFWDSTTYLDPFYLTMTNPSQTVVQKDRWYKSYVDCGCSVRHVEVRARNPEGLDSLQLVRVGESLPSPKMNNLRIEMLCNFSAIWDICLMMGISEATICEEDCQSVFYRSGASTDPRITDASEQVSDRVVRTVKSIYKTLKPDLRPTKEQITTPHHPMLDILPFPTLRSNFLKSQAFIDDDELFHDILSGLVCWGMSGLGKRDRNSGTGKASSGTPWDHRSWEAKPWFLRKYWALLGGEDGELVRQSEWWRANRGDGHDFWEEDGEQPPGESYSAFNDHCPPKLVNLWEEG